MKFTVAAFITGTSMVVTALTTSSALGSAPRGDTTSYVTDGPSIAEADDSGITTSWEEATLYDPGSEEVLATKRYGAGSAGRLLHPLRDLTRVAARGNGTGGTSGASGCIKVEIWQKRSTYLGSFAAKFGVWTDGCWKRSIQRVTVNRSGIDFAVGPGHHWNEATDITKYYYDFSANDGHPKSAFHHHQIGQFTSPVGRPFPDGTWYPKNTLDSYYNGTNQWFTSD